MKCSGREKLGSPGRTVEPLETSLNEGILPHPPLRRMALSKCPPACVQLRSDREGSEAGKTLGKPGEALLHIWMVLQGLLGFLSLLGLLGLLDLQAEMELVLP